MSSFIETPRFPADISQGSQGGPQWNTTIAVLRSGHEQRNENWTNSRYTYDVAPGIRSRSKAAELIDFFNMVRGRGRGFRYKDWADYSVTDEALAPTGAPTVQLIKTYGSGSDTWARNITKPISGATFEHNAGSISPSLDTATGIITLTPDSSLSITDITAANPGVVTAAGHGFSNGDEIYISGVVGMTEVNGTVFTIASVTTDTFEIVDTSGYTAYSSGGTAAKYVQSGDSLTWSGEFDVPVRFDVDSLPIALLEANYSEPPSIPLVEIRI